MPPSFVLTIHTAKRLVETSARLNIRSTSPDIDAAQHFRGELLPQKQVLTESCHGPTCLFAERNAISTASKNICLPVLCVVTRLFWQFCRPTDAMRNEAVLYSVIKKNHAVKPPYACTIHELPTLQLAPHNI